MPFESQFSLSLELAKVLPVRQILNAGAEQIIKLVRELKRDGSDFLVEEDLANIFGRGRIEPSLEEDFRKVVRIGSIQPLHVDSPIALDSGPGATVRRALKDRFYMSSVIQLSFLMWMHEEASLATALMEAMLRRYESKVQGATSDPDYEGILKTLQACSQQTSQYRWDDLCTLIEARFKNSRRWFHIHRSPLKQLSSNLLLGAMDYLYMVQTLPEDRFVMVNSQTGLVPMVIWAHYILGLYVLITGSPDGDVVFGHVERPQVIIQWNSTPSLDSAPLNGQRSSDLVNRDRLDQTEIYLLDADMHVILKTEPFLDSETEIKGQEYHRLRGYGTTYLQRYFNNQLFVADDDPVIADTANYAVSIAILMSRVARQRPAYPAYYGMDGHPNLNTELWRLFDSSDLLFQGINLDKRKIFEQLDKLKGKRLHDMAVPASIRIVFEQSGVPEDSHNSEFLRVLKRLATWVLAFGHVIDIESCSDLPLRMTSGTIPWKKLSHWDGVDDIYLESRSFFELIGTMRKENILESLKESRSFLDCHQGWSLFYSCLGDYDPQDIDCRLLCIKQGIPTNTRTNERKYRILDSPVLGPDKGLRVILDRNDSYVPRCVTTVVKRTEHYSSRSDGFWLSIRFDVEELNFSQSPSRQAVVDQRYTVYGSYGKSQFAMWGVVKTLPCTHPTEDGKSLPLDPDVQAIGGLPGRIGENSKAQISLSLVKGDARARWLALCAFSDGSREVLLRCNGCCEGCAVKFARSKEGKWFIVL